MEKKCNSDQWWNNNKCEYECKKHHVREKDYISNLATCSCELENTEETKTAPTSFDEKK